MVRSAFLINNKSEEEKSVKINSIDLNALKSVPVFCNEIKHILNKLNDVYANIYGETLWDYLQELVDKNEIFAGSSKYIFDKDIPKIELLKYKSVFNDIDIFVDRKKLKNLFYILSFLENVQFSNISTYLGQTKSEFYGFKISSVWEMNFSGKVYNFQIDFEGVEFDSDKPILFSKFSHSTDWNDLKKGFNGVFHKYLLRAITKAKSEDPNMIILTPKSKEEVDKIKIKKSKEIPNKMSFSVDRGLREKYRKITNLKFEGKNCYKELKSENSKYINCVQDIFMTFFEKSKYNYDKFNSFIGLVDYVKKEYNEEIISKIFNYCLKLLLEKNAPELYRDNPEEDYKLKMKMVDYFYEQFPYLEKQSIDVINFCFDYYSGDIFKEWDDRKNIK